MNDPSPDEPGALLSPGEAAHLLGVSPRTLQRWRRSGWLRAIRTPGGHYRFRSEDIQEVLDAGAASGDSGPDGPPHG